MTQVGTIFRARGYSSLMWLVQLIFWLITNFAVMNTFRKVWHVSWLLIEYLNPKLLENLSRCFRTNILLSLQLCQTNFKQLVTCQPAATYNSKYKKLKHCKTEKIILRLFLWYLYSKNPYIQKNYQKLEIHFICHPSVHKHLFDKIYGNDLF